MKLIALALVLTGCLDADLPEAGGTYTCSSTLSCLGTSYIVDPADFCIGDSEDVVNTYIQLALNSIVQQGLDCKDPHLLDIRCEAQNDFCWAD